MSSVYAKRYQFFVEPLSVHISWRCRKRNVGCESYVARSKYTGIYYNNTCWYTYYYYYVLYPRVVTISYILYFLLDVVFLIFFTHRSFVFRSRVTGLRGRQGRHRRVEPHARYGISDPLARTSPERNSILRRCPVRHPVSDSRRKHVQIPIRHQQRHAFLARPFR